MSLTLKEGGEYEKLPKGQYEGVCYKVVDMGTTEQEYEGVKSKKKRVLITFEIQGQKMSDDRPFVISRTYTASLFESAALRKDLVSWRGRNFTEEELQGFDIDKLLGKTANIEVGETKNGNPKIIGLFKPDGGVQSVPTVNETQKFDLDIYCKEWTGETCDESKAMCDVFADFPPWLQEDIEDSFEYKAAVKKGEDAGIVREKGPEAQELSEKVDEMIAQNKNPLTDEDIPF
tara:strand:- start:772 stop:1467 length:696 start_codon:yes stop_codon:yes gene_type:complete